MSTLAAVLMIGVLIAGSLGLSATVGASLEGKTPSECSVILVQDAGEPVEDWLPEDGCVMTPEQAAAANIVGPSSDPAEDIEIPELVEEVRAHDPGSIPFGLSQSYIEWFRSANGEHVHEASDAPSPDDLQTTTSHWLPTETLGEWYYWLLLNEGADHGSIPSTIDSHSSAPHAESNHLDITVVPVDGDNGVSGDHKWAVKQAARALRRDFGITYDIDVAHGCASTGHEDIFDARDDIYWDIRSNCRGLFFDSSWTRNRDSIVFAWIEEADHNGVAYLEGECISTCSSREYAPLAVGALAKDNGPDWPHAAIAGHEISHLLSGAHDAERDDPYEGCGSWWYYRMCESILHYPYAYSHGDDAAGIIWDSDNTAIVGNNVCACTSHGSMHQWSDHPGEN